MAFKDEYKTRIIIADNHNLFADALASLLNTATTEVTDVVNDAVQLNRLTYASYFNVILLDMELPGINDYTIITAIKRRCPGVKIIILATYDEEHFVVKSRLHGADGYLLKNAGRNELLQAIKQVSGGNQYFPLQKAWGHSILANYSLTKREKELLPLLIANHTTQEIAVNLQLSIYTIKTHRKNILQKLQIKTTEELRRFIVDHDL